MDSTGAQYKHESAGNVFAVVSGGSKGIGKAICRLLAAEGCHIATCARGKKELEKLHFELSQAGNDVITYQADLGNRTEITSFASHISERWQRVDLLVNNAGIFHPGSILDESEGRLDEMLDINLKSSYHLTRELMGLIRRSQKGHIFNMCSIASKIAYPNGGSYSISKFAQLGFSKVLREELKSENIRVTALLPGATWSDSWAGVDLPRTRLMEAEDIAKILWTAYKLSPTADVEELIIRPQLGDL